MPNPEPIDAIAPFETGHRSARRAAFLAQDGTVLSSALAALDSAGILPGITDEEFMRRRMSGLPDQAFGRLRVVLRVLVGQGWLTGVPDDRRGHPPGWTGAGAAAVAHHGDYLAVGRFLSAFADVGRDGWPAAWEAAAPLFSALMPRVAARWDTDGLLPEQAEIITGHLDGALLIPAVLAGAAEHPSSPEVDKLLGIAGERFSHAGGFPAGFGVVGSYLPMLARLGGLLGGAAEHDPAQYVDRALNARAGRAVHVRYDKDLLAVVLDLFNRPAPEEQPRFVVEVGCGNGSRLRDIHQAIRDRTARGTVLDAYPVVMVGVDGDPVALETARAMLGEHDVPAVLVQGTVDEPERIAAELARHGLAMDEGLHVRAFADHARRYRGTGGSGPVSVPGAGDGAYVDEEGRPVPDEAVERDLVEHLRRWAPYVRRHGLVVLAAHTIAPQVARRFPGRLQSVALDACHGLSHQYPVGHDRWLQCCRAAGLETVPYESRRYPAHQPFVAVSLNRLLPVEVRTTPHVPAVPLSPAQAALPQDDGRGLHELLFAGGDTRRPRPWAADPTGWIVAQALHTIERRIATGGPGQTIRVLDYGAGTGLGAIELLKALTERRTDRLVAESGMKLEMHLADIRTPWFDQGERLLGGHPWTRFHELRGPDGKFRTMAEIMGPDKVDIVLASMVFHLIPPKSLTKLAADLARLVHPGGMLLWNAPDIGPAGSEAFLFHDANRAIRQSVLTSPVDETLPAQVREAVARVHAAHCAETDKRAGRRILPAPNRADALVDIFDTHFTGNVHQQNFEILPDELLDTLLVPSNAEEYFPELPERKAREAVVRAFSARVVPRLRERSGGTATGLSLKWTFGKHTPRHTPGKAPR